MNQNSEINSEPNVVAVVLNWNNFSDTFETIRSLKGQKYVDLDILLVDNGSSDNSFSRLRRKFPSIEGIQLENNLGFPGGNNKGIEYALNNEADYIWLVNNDVLFPQSETLSQMVAIAESNSSIGILSPLITHYPETNEIWFEQGWIHDVGGIAGHTNNQRWYLPTSDCAVGPNVKSNSVKENYVYNEYVPLCSALVPSEVFETSGLLSEDYFLYGSDVEFCTRIRKQGYRLLTTTDLICYHKVSASSDSGSGKVVSYYSARNTLLIRKDTYGDFSIRFIINFIWWLVVQLVDRLHRSDIGGAIGLIRGTLAGVFQRRGMGPYP